MDKKYMVHVVPHTHWDREWYYTFEEFRYRLVKMMDRLLALMHNDVIKYFVADGHTLLIDDYLEIRPEREDDIRALVKEGRLLLGPWYTQPNVYMSGAEAQVRNLMRGRQDMEKYGDTMEMASINYLPDMFGFPAQMPQMMKGFGMTHMIGARGMPFGSPAYFRWEGSDGTTVMVVNLLNGYNNGNGLSDREDPIVFKVFGESIKMPSLTEQLKFIWEDNSELTRALAPQLLIMNGVDHMWANPSMISTLAKIEELYPQMSVRQSTLRKYIDAVDDTLESEPPLYTGEHRDPRQKIILPGSQSNRMDIKKYNQKLEDLLERRVEPMMVRMACLGEKDLPYALLRKAWEYMLMNQAHDSLCAALPEPAWREVTSRFEKADDIAREIHTELEQRLFRRVKNLGDDAIMIYNPTPADRDGVITFDIITGQNTITAQPHLYDNGEEVPVYIQDVRSDMVLRYVPFTGLVGQLAVRIFTVTADAGSVPSTGYKVLDMRLETPHARPVDGIVRGQDVMENEFLHVKVNADASLDIIDKTTGRLYSRVHRFIDEGETGCSFMHIPPVNDPVCVSNGRNIELRIMENNPAKGILRVSQTMLVPENLNAESTGRSEHTVEIGITTDVILRKNNRMVEFDTVVDNTAKQHRFRVVFPTDIISDESYSGLAYDVAVRPIQPEKVNYVQPGTHEAYYGYHPMHDFCGISDGAAGAAIAADGILEFEVLPMRRTLCLTLLRATEHLHIDAWYHGSKFNMPTAQLIGENRYRYAFIPHSSGYGEVMERVEAFRHPLYTVQKDFLEEQSMPDYIAPTADLNTQDSFIKVESKLVTTAIKPAENGDGFILRMYNPLATSDHVRITLTNSLKLKKAYRTRLDETDEEAIPVMGNGLSLDAAGKEIVTLRIITQ